MAKQLKDFTLESFAAEYDLALDLATEALKYLRSKTKPNASVIVCIAILQMETDICGEEEYLADKEYFDNNYNYKVQLCDKMYFFCNYPESTD
jgi:hypothetical protein